MEDPAPQSSPTNQDELLCHSCRGPLVYEPGSLALKCNHCGAHNPFEENKVRIKELDFFTLMHLDQAPKMNVFTVDCNSCGATTTFDEHIFSGKCTYCDNTIVVKDAIKKSSIFHPAVILPFKLSKEEAFQHFMKWVKRLFWAPRRMKREVTRAEKFTGVYTPFWTYDASTTTHYSGMRGDNYTVLESYTTRDSNGNMVTRTRTVTKIRWSRASGTVYDQFDDVLVAASNSLPRNYLEELDPWDLENLTGYDEKFMAGSVAEIYQVGLREGFERAGEKMKPVIQSTIKRNIGGDHQRITSMDVDYTAATFKHILLPVYMSSYQYRGKPFQFLINARTGEVQGKYPLSIFKIVVASLLAAGAIAGLVYLFTLQ